MLKEKSPINDENNFTENILNGRFETKTRIWNANVKMAQNKDVTGLYAELQRFEAGGDYDRALKTCNKSK